jgi:LCP family protein required for cell wall assembly
VGRLAWQLGFIFHRNPIAAIGDVLGSSGGSSVGQKAQSLQRINIALYGYGGDGHDGAYLSDSIMVVSIQPQASGPPQVAEISLPRDWKVPIDLGNGHSYKGKINEAYSDGQTDSYPNRADAYKGEMGGGALADATLEKLLGIHIDHFVGIDFHAFQYAVDAVGGVDVVVPRSFTDAQYPHGECDAGDCALTTVHFNAGLQHMDGRTALVFARSRHGDNGEAGDFSRSRRQQLILQALKQKIVSVDGIARLPDVLGALGGHVITDMGIGDSKALYDLVKDVAPASIERVSIDTTNFLYDCGYPSDCDSYYLYAHDTSYQSISHYVQDVFPPVVAQTAKVPVTVLDASGSGAGASARWSQLLGDTHLQASDGGRTALSATTHVFLSGSSAGAAQTAQYLSTLFGVPVEQAPASAAASGAAAATGTATAAAEGVTLVLGADEERAFNRTTPGYYGSYTYSTRTTTRSTTTTTTRSTTTTSSTSTTTTRSSTSSTTSLPVFTPPPTPSPRPRP